MVGEERAAVGEHLHLYATVGQMLTQVFGELGVVVHEGDAVGQQDWELVGELVAVNDSSCGELTAKTRLVSSIVR